MRRLAQIICPVVAALIVMDTLTAVQSYNPEPESATLFGFILLSLLLASSQAPLALAPYASGNAARALAAAGMLPSAVVIVLIAIDLAPRVLFFDRTSRSLVFVLAAAAMAYTLAFATIRYSGSADPAAQRTP